MSTTRPMKRKNQRSRARPPFDAFAILWLVAAFVVFAAGVMFTVYSHRARLWPHTRVSAALLPIRHTPGQPLVTDDRRVDHTPAR